MAKKRSGGYLGLGYAVSLILTIIPVTCWIIGLILAAQHKQWLGFILRLFLTIPFFWIIDIVTMLTQHKVYVLC